MTRFKLLGAALIFAAIAAPASAHVSEPAAAASQNPNFSIYSSGGYSGGGYAPGYSRPMAVQPFDEDARAQLRAPVRPQRAHRAPVKRY